MRNQAALKVIFEQEVIPAKIETPKFFMQQQSPRYPDEATRQLAIKQQQMNF